MRPRFPATVAADGGGLWWVWVSSDSAFRALMVTGFDGPLVFANIGVAVAPSAGRQTF